MSTRIPVADLSARWPAWMEGISIAAGWMLVLSIVLLNRAADPIPFSLHTIGVTLVE